MSGSTENRSSEIHASYELPHLFFSTYSSTHKNFSSDGSLALLCVGHLWEWLHRRVNTSANISSIVLPCCKKKKKKIWNRVDCQGSEQKIPNTQEIKRTLFNWTKQDKTCSFPSPASHIQLTQVEFVFLFFCFCVVWSLKTEDVLENLHVLSCFVQLKSVLLISYLSTEG